MAAFESAPLLIHIDGDSDEAIGRGYPHAHRHFFQRPHLDEMRQASEPAFSFDAAEVAGDKDLQPLDAEKAAVFSSLLHRAGPPFPPPGPPPPPSGGCGRHRRSPWGPPPPHHRRHSKGRRALRFVTAFITLTTVFVLAMRYIPVFTATLFYDGSQYSPSVHADIEGHALYGSELGAGFAHGGMPPGRPASGRPGWPPHGLWRGPRRGPPHPHPHPPPKPSIKECFKLDGADAEANLTLAVWPGSAAFVAPSLAASSISFLRDGPAGRPPHAPHHGEGHGHGPGSGHGHDFPRPAPEDGDKDGQKPLVDVRKDDDDEQKPDEDHKKHRHPHPPAHPYPHPAPIHLPVTVTRSKSDVTGLVSKEPELQVCVLSAGPIGEGLGIYDEHIRALDPVEDAGILSLVHVAVHLPEGFPPALIGLRGPPPPHHGPHGEARRGPPRRLWRFFGNKPRDD